MADDLHCRYDPGRLALEKIGETRIFSGTENLMKSMDTLVDTNSEFFQAFQDSKRVNILLLGINDELSDTIMLCSYDMENDHVDLISIPRDTYMIALMRTARQRARSIRSIETGEPLGPQKQSATCLWASRSTIML